MDIYIYIIEKQCNPKREEREREKRRMERKRERKKQRGEGKKVKE